MSDAPLLVLVDGSSYLYRAYHALPALSTSTGRPTGAIYGVIGMLRRLLADHRPVHAAVVFDAPGRTFREAIYAEYKANRPAMPEDLAVQIEPLHALVEALGFPLLQVPGVEADDVIATLARRAEAAGFRVVVSTGDKDLAQLVSPRVTLVNTMDDTRLDPAGVVAKFGVPPERIVDWLALVGDTVDNVPGVPKVGPKTAAKWLTEYGSLDGVIAHAGEVGGKVGESLRASLEQLPVSRDLVTVRDDLALEAGPDELVLRPPDREALGRLFGELEFRTWLAEVLKPGEDAAPAGETVAAAPVYETVLDREAFEAWRARLEAAGLFAFDTETTSLDYIEAEVVGVSFAVEPGAAAYVPVAHAYPGAPGQLPREWVLGRLRGLLEDPRRAKVGHNLKYDMSVLARAGVALRGIAFDTMLESYVLDSTASRPDMDSMALKLLGHKTIRYEDVAGKGASQVSFDRVPLEQAGPYAAEDAEVALRLHRTLWPKLEAEPQLAKLFHEVEMPLVPVLSRMERNGVQVDTEALARQGAELAGRIAELEAEAWRLAGMRFNLASPAQIQGVLFDKMQLPVLERTPTGQPSTAESALQELADIYPLPRVILDHRALTKLKSTYADALPQRVSPVTGRVHTSYHQAVAVTGRLSSSDPNLQNIPVRTPEGRRIRQAFVAPPGHRLVSADYTQIELRIMAHLSADDRLLAAFEAGEDVHRATAAEVFGVPPEAVSPDQRRAAKAINFGLIYGMSAFGLARQIGVERGAAQDYVDRYFARYPGVRAYMDATREQARERGYVETVFGRRLYVPEIRSRNRQRRQYAERTAINAPMQGTAADIVKRAMVRVDHWLEETGFPARMIMQVHDELVLEVGEDAVPQAVEALRAHMTGAAELTVPLLVDVGVGANWDEAH
jgi:DNA polymerase-1